ncbi:MAG TPA: sugar ABC transporter permease [Tepidisphaeraceae bacterium]|nr:sugar ABC transporter permease [Tepidisphaeraceae bacterium]
MTRRRRSDFWPAMAFLLPNLLGFLIFMAGPLLVSLGASFTNWNLQNIIPFHFTGLKNLHTLLHDQLFWIYLANTIYMMLGMPFAILGALGLALLLNQKARGVAVYRTLFYIPSFTSGVALMLLWKQLLNPDFGPINVCISHLLQWLHLTNLHAPYWLQSTKNLLGLGAESVSFSWRNFGIGSKDGLNFMGMWTMIGGTNMLLYMAALSGISPDLYEAAAIDGAGKWRKFTAVTWPQLMPTTFFIFIMSIIGGLQGGFEQARIMTLGGPAGSTTTLAYYIYITAFQQFQMGYASTIAWVMFLMIFVLTIFTWRFGKGATE